MHFSHAMARTYALLLTLIAPAPACGGSTEPTLFVTTAPDGANQVSIGIVVSGQRIAAYVCADDPASDPYPGWFTGTVAGDGHFALVTAGFGFSGVISRNTASGSIIDPDGSTVTWSSTVTAHAPLTGLYIGDASCATGVVVIADDPSQPPLARGAWCNVMQVTPVTPIALVDDRLAVDVAGATSWRTYVRPFREPQ